MSKDLLKALQDVISDLKLRANLREDRDIDLSDGVLMRAENAIKEAKLYSEIGTISE